MIKAVLEDTKTVNKFVLSINSNLNLHNLLCKASLIATKTHIKSQLTTIVYKYRDCNLGKREGNIKSICHDSD